MLMVFFRAILLFFIAVLAGTLNSVAGGGSFFTLPTMIFIGMPLVQANTTSATALWPGVAASIGAYRRELLQVRLGLIFLLVSTSLIGSIGGAILLLHTPQAIFGRLLPYLLLAATLLFSLSGPIIKRLRMHKVQEGDHLSLLTIIGVCIAQFVIAVYGGYFGGGIGILMLATLALMGIENIHVVNALKVLLATVINGVAAITFIIANAVIWPQAIWMIIGAIVGGYGGAHFARKIEQKWIRYFIIGVGLAMSIYFFLHSR